MIYYGHSRSCSRFTRPIASFHIQDSHGTIASSSRTIGCGTRASRHGPYRHGHSLRTSSSRAISMDKYYLRLLLGQEKKRPGQKHDHSDCAHGQIDVALVPCKIYTRPLARCAHGNDRLRPLASRARARLTHKRGHSCSHGPTHQDTHTATQAVTDPFASLASCPRIIGFGH